MSDLLKAATEIYGGFSAYNESRTNAGIDLADSRIAIRTGQERAAFEQRQGARVKAAQGVAFFSAGVSGSSGTALQLAAQEELNAAARASQELEAASSESRRRIQSADLHKRRGRSSLLAGLISASPNIYSFGKTLTKRVKVDTTDG